MATIERSEGSHRFTCTRLQLILSLANSDAKSKNRTFKIVSPFIYFKFRRNRTSSEICISFFSDSRRRGSNDRYSHNTNWLADNMIFRGISHWIIPPAVNGSCVLIEFRLFSLFSFLSVFRMLQRMAYGKHEMVEIYTKIMQMMRR